MPAGLFYSIGRFAELSYGRTKGTNPLQLPMEQKKLPVKTDSSSIILMSG